MEQTENHILKAHWESFEIKCQDIVYGDTFDPKMGDQNSGEPVWFYKEENKEARYVEFNPKKFRPDAGKYSIYAVIKGTKDQSNSITVTVNKAVPKYNVPQSKNIHAHCGDKLSDVSLAVQNNNGHFEWKNPDKKLQEGHSEEYIKFIPNDSKNYTESKDILVQFEVIHDITAKNCFEYEAETEPVAPKTDKKGKKVEEAKAGHWEFYRCKGCKKLFEADGQEHDASWFVKPCYVEELTVELGKKYKLSDFVKAGQEGVDTKSTAFKNQKYLKLNKNTGTLTAVKYYKNKLKKQTIITFQDKKGDKQKVKIKVTIASPKVVKAKKKFTKKTQGIQIKRKAYTTVSGKAAYRYTIKYNVKDAKKLIVKASGLSRKSTQDRMNKDFKKEIAKSKGTVTFTIAKSSIKKKKLTFKIVADYGHKNKSNSVSITE